jgi:hypothetical protein
MGSRSVSRGSGGRLPAHPNFAHPRGVTKPLPQGIEKRETTVTWIETAVFVRTHHRFQTDSTSIGTQCVLVPGDYYMSRLHCVVDQLEKGQELWRHQAIDIEALP